MKKNYFIFILTVMVCITVVLFLKLIDAHKEYSVWETRKSVLEEELKVLQKEVKEHGTFLKKLRNDPKFQEDVARRELGYATETETTFRFSKD
jgi:cell division protein FtsB